MAPAILGPMRTNNGGTRPKMALQSGKPDEPHTDTEESVMGAKEILAELGNIDGCVSAAVFTPTGEALATYCSGQIDTKNAGVLANNVLLNAQKASLEMNTGRGSMVHIEAEKAHILVRCLNEGTDPLKSQPGKSHIHLVVALA